MHSAAVVGLGLVGGSLARDLAARGVRVLGYDRDAAALRAARDEGVVAEALGAGLEGVEGAEVVVLACPVAAAVQTLDAHHRRLGGARLVTDVGSTKRTIVEAAHRLGLGPRFVGSHPIAGSEASGWAASRTGLFAGAKVYLCPPESFRAEAVDLAHALWEQVGAVPQVVHADWHDQHVAWISHLPQLLSTALGLALAAEGVPRAELGPGGASVARLAGSSPEVWTEVLIYNAGFVLRALAGLEGRLAELRHAVELRDADAIARHFAEARAWAGKTPS
ncbi:MAG TPA: prephenate dehydrogenase, partial [Longimicrobiaceae bacterium]|nr:prephenate dehydrogenase [Longimicrobiaceae bacterium]